MRLLPLVLGLLVGCVSSSVVDGINPVVGCTKDSDCEPGYFCQAGGCQASQRVCDGPNDTADCEANEICRPNPAPGCADPSSGQDCPAQYLCEPAPASGSTT